MNPLPTVEAHASAPIVMLVDDHEDSVAMYSLYLQAIGYRPLSAATAEEAYQRAVEVHPDVIVADVTLAGSSGLELTRRLRDGAQTNDTGIIVLTGHAGAAVKRQADEAGCDRFLVKPCMPDALALEIRDVLATRRSSSTRGIRGNDQ